MALLALVFFSQMGQRCLAQDPFDELRLHIEQFENGAEPQRLAPRSRVSNNDSIVAIGFSTDDLPPAPSPENAADGTDLDSKVRRLVEKYLAKSRTDEFEPESEADPQAEIQALRAELQDLRKRLEKFPNSTWANDGVTLSSADGKFKTHFGGAVHFDAISYTNVANGITVPGGAGTQDSVEFRRLRFRLDGTMHENIDWVSEFDFALALQNLDPTTAASQSLGLRNTTTPGAGNTAGPGFTPGPGTQSGNTINVMQPTTVFMTIKDIPTIGNVRIGNQQNWLSLEHIVSARFLDFMERSPIMDAFSGANNNGYAPGVSFFNVTENKQMTWQLGAYNNNVYNSGYTYNVGNQWMYGGRMTWTPYYDECSEGRYLVHTGLGVEYRQFETNVGSSTGFDNVRIRSRGVLRNAVSTLDPNFADTGNFFALGQAIINPEIAVVWDRWSFQGEVSNSYFYGARAAKGATGVNNFGTVMMNGGYVQALYFLTGEHKEYNRNTGTFTRVVPNEKFNVKKETWGAWQVGGRYDWLDLNAKGISGGIENDWTLGLNWFLNANARLQFNYVFTQVSNAGTYAAGPNGSLVGSRFQGDGLIQTVGTRLDFNF